MSYKFEKLSVLVVEDTAPMRKLICSILEKLGVGTIIEAENGKEGFEIFCKKNPDIVLTDWMMEEMNGIELTREIRMSSLSTDRMAPVIIITGYSALHRVSEARDAGVTEFLVKPFSANDISRRIAHVISHPRDFIDAPLYFGPDRRRRKDEHYSGPRRRSDDPIV